MCSWIIIEYFSTDSTMTLGFKGPSHPTWASLYRKFFMMKMNWFKFSIPSLDCLKLMMTPTTLKIRSLSIYDPTIPRTWQARRKTCKNCITCFAHQIKVFSISTSHNTNHWYNCNSFF
jgi:hypothetical protein